MLTDLGPEILGNAMTTPMSNISEPVKATDLEGTPVQAPTDPKLERPTHIPLIEGSREEKTEETTGEMRLTPIFHPPVPEPDLAVALLGPDDVPDLLLLGTGEICFPTA